MRRRLFLGLILGLAALRLVVAVRPWAPSFPLTLSDDEWRKRLAPEQFRLLRLGETEAAGSSPLAAEIRPGQYDCAGCAQPLFDAGAKFDAGNGWPSFSAALDGAIMTEVDAVVPGAEMLRCTRCGGFHGRRFKDGPAPGGWRYSVNGGGLAFRPA